MSLLTDFAKAGFNQAKQVIGTETLAIGGGSGIAVVRTPIENARQFEDGGFALDADVAVDAEKSVFEAAYTSALSAYIGLTATMDGKTFRVARIGEGLAHYRIHLMHEQTAT